MNSPRQVFLSLPLFFVVVFGCGQSRTPSKVSGKVTYKGQTVSAGTISFHRQGKDQSGVYSYPLNSDGTYSGTDMPAEEMVVTVETESANPNQVKQTYAPPPMAGAGKAMGPDEYRKKMKEKGAPVEASGNSGPYVKIPKKYAEKETSPLKATLTKGKNEFNFDLTD
jgi:hypothetical protein